VQKGEEERMTATPAKDRELVAKKIEGQQRINQKKRTTKMQLKSKESRKNCRTQFKEHLKG
jgi:hypothetical protein